MERRGGFVDLAAGTQQPPIRISKRRMWLFAIAALLGVVVILAGIKAAQIGTMIKAGKSFAMPPESVTSAKVVAEEWQGSSGAVGTLVAVRSVTLSSDLGTMIKAGKSFAMPPESVTSAKVVAEEWQGSSGAVGTLVAVRSVTLSS